MSTIIGWGWGGFGSLCTSDNFDIETPIEIKVLTQLQVKSMSVGLWHSLIIDHENKLFSVGRGRYGALGIHDETDNYLTPRPVTKFEKYFRVKKASAGDKHSMCITEDGTLWGWGFGVAKGLGNTELSSEPAVVDSLVQYKMEDISSGAHHSACVTSCGKIFCWGLFSRNPVEASPNSNILFKSVKCGGSHTMAITSNGELYGFGMNDYHQVGDPSKKNIKHDEMFNISIPVGENGEKYGNKWIQVECGLRHTLALTNDKYIFLWGQIHDGANKPSGELKTPTLVNIDDNIRKSITKIACGKSSFCFLTRDGRVFTWGANLHSNLGHPDVKINISKPTVLSSLSGVHVSDVFCGGYQYFLKTGSSGTVDMNNLLDEPIHVDLELLCGSRSKKVHRSILCARSITIASILDQKLKSLSSGEVRNSTNDNEGLDNIDEDCQYGIDAQNDPKISVGSSSSSSSSIQTPSLPVNYDMIISLDVSHLIEEQIFDSVLEFIYTNLTKTLLPDYHDEFKETICQKLKICKDITIFENIASSSEKPYINAMQSLINNQTLHPDVIFELDDGHFYAHKSIISCRSQYFHSMFSKKWVESKLDIVPFPDCTNKVFEKLLQFLYMGENVEIEPEIAVAVLEVGVRINWNRMKNIAEHVIIGHLDDDNVLDMINISEYCDSPTIRKACVRLVASKFEQFCTLPEYNEKLDQYTQDEIESTAAVMKSNLEGQKEVEKKEKELLKLEEDYRKKRELASIADDDHEKVDKILGKKCSIM